MNLFDYNFLSPCDPCRSNIPPNNLDYFDPIEVSQQQTDSLNDSSATCCLQDVSNSANASHNILKSPERQIQKAIYKGPEVFGKVLGPTADESILVGLQALMDMAGSLEFNSCSLAPNAEETPIDNSEGISPNSASYQYKEKKQPESKCQHSQTRVLPKSMTCYNPEEVNYPDEEINADMVPCPHFSPSKFQSPIPCQLRSVDFPNRNSNTPFSQTTPANSPCSKFYHQMTTISVLENAHQETSSSIPVSRNVSPKVVEERPLKPPDPLTKSQDPIHPNTYISMQQETPQSCVSGVSLDKSKCALSYKRTSVSSSNGNDGKYTNIYTCPVVCSKKVNATAETQSMLSTKTSSVACACNFCIPISAGLSKHSSRVSSTSRTQSRDQLSSPKSKKCDCCSYCKGKEQDKRRIQGEKCMNSKACHCSLIPKNMEKSDAAISCLKISTSSQYHKSLILCSQSKSTQCGRIKSSIQICTESGDFRPQRKRSAKLNGSYDNRDFSETRYCMDSKKSLTASVIPLLDCNDDFSKFSFEKPAKICLEMGDSFACPPTETRYAITKITKFRDFSTFEVMKSTSKKPKCMPKAVEGVFVLKKENYYNSKTHE